MEKRLKDMFDTVKGFCFWFFDYFKLPYLLYKNSDKSTIVRYLGWFFWAPTYLFAEFRKQGLSENDRAELIKRYNNFRLSLAVIMLILLGILDIMLVFNDYDMGDYTLGYGIAISLLVWFFPLSRCNEVFSSFICDALDKVEGKKSTSNLSYAERILLALKSYLELVANFAIIYLLVPQEWVCEPISNIFDALYFSGVTITTLGYGDFSPNHWFTQMLSVYEVFCGFILLIVSFTIYVGRGLNEKSTQASFRGRLRKKKLNVLFISLAAKKRTKESCPK